MKLYISNNIEARAGRISRRDKGSASALRADLSAELAELSKAALEAGASDVCLQDKGIGEGLVYDLFPKECRFVRGREGDIFGATPGLGGEKFDNVFIVRASFPSDSNIDPLYENSSNGIESVKINEERAGIFAINLYNAGYLGIPVGLVSGDKGACDFAEDIVKGVATVPVSKNAGGAEFHTSPLKTSELLRDAARKVISAGALKGTNVNMPQSFEVSVRYESYGSAYRNSFFPGAIQVAPGKIRFKSTNYMDVLRFLLFCVR